MCARIASLFGVLVVLCGFGQTDPQSAKPSTGTFSGWVESDTKVDMLLLSAEGSREKPIGIPVGAGGRFRLRNLQPANYRLALFPCDAYVKAIHLDDGVEGAFVVRAESASSSDPGVRGQVTRTEINTPFMKREVYSINATFTFGHSKWAGADLSGKSLGSRLSILDAGLRGLLGRGLEVGGIRFSSGPCGSSRTPESSPAPADKAPEKSPTP